MLGIIQGQSLFLSYASLGFKKFEINMVSFPGLKKDLSGSL